MKKFICKRCGNCCQGESTVSLSKSEIEAIASFLKIPVPELLELYTHRVCQNRIEMKVRNGRCIFYDEEVKLCKVHPVKPKACKEWPFPKAVFRSREDFEIIKANCPGLATFEYEDLKSIVDPMDG